jgi:hypothetical protein
VASDRGVTRDRGGEVVGWRVLIQALVRAVVIEMAHVTVKNNAGVSFVVDQQPVGALGADAADEPFRIAVRLRHTGRDLDHGDAFGAEDGVERGGELGVPIADQEAEGADLITEVHQQGAGNLGGPGGGGVNGHAEEMHPAGADLHDEQHVQAAQGEGVEGEKKSVASSPVVCARRKLRHPVSLRCGAGPSPAAAKIRRMVPVPTRWPSPTSSPWILRCPQEGLSYARRSTRIRMSSVIGGRPDRWG